MGHVSDVFHYTYFSPASSVCKGGTHLKCSRKENSVYFQLDHNDALDISFTAFFYRTALLQLR